MKQSLRLLIVEDESLVAMDLEDILEDCGHVVLDVAANIEQVMIGLDRHADLDGVLLDANLGGVSSLPVAEKLDSAGIPYVITSGYDRHQLIEDGFTGPSIAKPYRTPEIEAVLQVFSDVRND